MAAVYHGMRAIWTGSLSFGLINIPVSIYSASRDRALKFRLLDKKSHSPIGYVRVREDTNREVKYEDIVKGYEYEKGSFVELTDEDFKKASPKKTKSIEIINFADERDVPSKFIDKPYFIEPDKKALKAYVLLREALRKSGKVGIARFIIKDKEHIGMVKVEDDAILLIQLRFQDELRSVDDLHIPQGVEYTKKELEIALLLIKQLEKHFNASGYEDTYTKELKKIIDKKAKGKPIKVTEKEPVPTDMKDLLVILKESLEETKTTA